MRPIPVCLPTTIPSSSLLFPSSQTLPFSPHYYLTRFRTPLLLAGFVFRFFDHSPPTPLALISYRFFYWLLSLLLSHTFPVWSGFYKKTIKTRLDTLKLMYPELQESVPLPLSVADNMIENCIVLTPSIFLLFSLFSFCVFPFLSQFTVLPFHLPHLHYFTYPLFRFFVAFLLSPSPLLHIFLSHFGGNLFSPSRSRLEFSSE